MRQDNGFRGGMNDSLHRVEGAVRRVYHDAEPVAFFHHLCTKGAQAMMHYWADLKIADIVNCVVYELELSETALVRFSEPIEMAFVQEVGPFGVLNENRPAFPMANFQIGILQDSPDSVRR